MQFNVMGYETELYTYCEATRREMAARLRRAAASEEADEDAIDSSDFKLIDDPEALAARLCSQIDDFTAKLVDDEPSNATLVDDPEALAARLCSQIDDFTAKLVDDEPSNTKLVDDPEALVARLFSRIDSAAKK